MSCVTRIVVINKFGNGEKFITPVIANGKAFVGTPSGVAVFGLLSRAALLSGMVFLLGDHISERRPLHPIAH